MTYRRKSNLAIIAAALLTVALLLGLGCGREASMALSEKGAAPTSSMRQSSANTPTNAAAESGEMLGGSKAAADGTLARRKIITRGEIALTVKTYATSRKKLDELVKSAGGFIAKSDVRHNLGQVSWAQVVIRVPQSQVGNTVAVLRQLGSVQHESIGSEDVTERYFDVKARLQNAKRLESRLLGLLQSKTAKLTDVLHVERELARVRETIERFEGRLRLLDNLTSLATLTVTLYIQQHYTPARLPSLGEDAADAWSNSWRSLQAAGRSFVLVLIALVPWIIPLGLAGYGLLRLFRRWRRRKKRDAA